MTWLIVAHVLVNLVFSFVLGVFATVNLRNARRNSRNAIENARHARLNEENARGNARIALCLAGDTDEVKKALDKALRLN